MKTGRNRPWRKDHRRGTALLILAVTLALAAAPAQAGTGGASPVPPGEGGAGGGLAFTPMRWAGATWYGPGLYGNSTACGQRLTSSTVGVAHRNLPCGTTVKFVYHGRSIVTQVIDRGPYSRGNAWDLTLAAARALRFDKVGADRVGYAVSLEYARNSPAAGQSGR
jgi:rare lipoprotein A (RlpA)-like double-psi beta-barrel protein